MNDTTKIDTLRNIEFFAGLTDEQLGKLAEVSTEAEYRERATIFQEHDLSREVYLVVRGRVSLVIRVPSVGCRQIMTVGSGEILAWSPVLQRPRLTATAMTLMPTSLMVFDREQLLELCRQNTQFGFEFMRRTAEVLAQRLYATRLQLLELGGVHLPEVVIESD